MIRALIAALTLSVLTMIDAPVVRADNPPMAINLAPVRDWSSQQPFLNVMKTARRWIGHKPGQWGGVTFDELNATGLFDTHGWPTRVPDTVSSVGTFILTDLPPDAQALAGRYVLRFEGTGIVEATGRARNTRYGKGLVSFDFTPGQGPVEIRIQRSDRRGTGDYVRNITVVREDRLADYDAGAVFNPDFLDVVQGFEVLRFMDWANINDAEDEFWADRAHPDDFSFGLRGVPYEVMLDLTTQVGGDPWISLPHLINDAYVHAFGTLMHGSLAPTQKLYVEYSNEVWNWQFLQAEWAGDRAQARWGSRDQGTQFYGMRAAEIARILTTTFADQASDHLVNVISTQTGWLGLEKGILTAPLWQGETPGNLPPYTAFDAYAVTGYFGALGVDRLAGLVHQWLDASETKAQNDGQAQGLSGPALTDYVAMHRYDLAVQFAAQEVANGTHSGDPEGTLEDLITRLFPYHAQIARDFDLDLIMYEGGTHIVGVGSVVGDDRLAAFFTHFNYTTQMGDLYQTLLQGWQDAGGRLFNVYSDVQAPGRWGSWGAQRYLGDQNPRWQTIEAWK